MKFQLPIQFSDSEKATVRRLTDHIPRLSISIPARKKKASPTKRRNRAALKRIKEVQAAKK